jgi:hypothetical protein
MQPLCSGRAELLRLLDGVIVIGYLAAVPALDKSDTFAVSQINRWYDIHFQAFEIFDCNSSDSM